MSNQPLEPQPSPEPNPMELLAQFTIADANWLTEDHWNNLALLIKPLGFADGCYTWTSEDGTLETSHTWTTGCIRHQPTLLEFYVHRRILEKEQLVRQAAAAREDQAAAKLDALTGGDSEADHGTADQILLAHAGPTIASAYRLLVQRAGWWAAA